MLQVGTAGLDGKVKIDQRDLARARYALVRIAAEGCRRLTNPHTCRQPNGYPSLEWCEGCIAADGLGLPVEWFQLKDHG